MADAELSQFPGPFADQDMASLKVPPHSVEAEQSVLGGLMLDNGAWETVVEVLTEDQFYRRDHRLVFRVMAQLANLDQPLDVVTVSESLERQGLLEEVGGLAYLAELARNTPTASNIRAYAQIVHERGVLRRLIQAAGRIAETCYQPGGRPCEEVLDDAERLVFEIAESRPSTGGPTGVSDLLAQSVERIDRLFHSNDPITGLSSGFADLDEMTSGLQPADLVIVAGRPSMGKTTLRLSSRKGRRR